PAPTTPRSSSAPSSACSTPSARAGWPGPRSAGWGAAGRCRPAARPSPPSTSRPGGSSRCGGGWPRPPAWRCSSTTTPRPWRWPRVGSVPPPGYRRTSGWSCRRGSGEASCWTGACSTAGRATPATSATWWSSRAGAAASAAGGAASRGRPRGGPSRPPPAGRRPRPDRPSSPAPVRWSAGRWRRRPTCSTSASPWWRGRWRWGSGRRSSPPPRPRSTISPGWSSPGPPGSAPPAWGATPRSSGPPPSPSTGWAGSLVTGEGDVAPCSRRGPQSSRSAALDPTRRRRFCLRFPPGFASRRRGGRASSVEAGHRGGPEPVTSPAFPATPATPSGVATDVASGAEQRRAGRRGLPWAGLAVGAVVAAGIVARFVALSHLWLDEALTVNIARLPLRSIPGALRHDGSPPLYYALLHVWMRLFGSTTVAVRAFSGVCSVACLPLAWRVGRRAGGHTAATAFLVLLALSPFAVQYATEARMYSLCMLLVLAGGLALANMMERPTWPMGGAVALLTAALLLTHYYALYTIAAVGLVLLWHAWRGEERAAARRAVAAVVAGGVLFAPWVPILL